MNGETSVGNPEQFRLGSHMPRQVSWRDPAGFVVLEGNRILRNVAHDHVAMVESLLANDWLQAHMRAGRVARSWWTQDPPAGASSGSPQNSRWLEHERVEFPAFPHEITALQLHDAAKLTLDLAIDAVKHGWILKDATAWNVLFATQGPVFCDLLSFEPLTPSATWAGYAQFQRCFTIPLLIYKLRRIPPRLWFLGEREGVAPEFGRPLISGLAAWTQPGLEAVTLPTLLARRGARGRTAASSGNKTLSNPDVQQHLLRATLARLKKHIERLRPNAQGSSWSDYRATRDHYGESDIRHKEAYVRTALSNAGINSVLDLGCNTGEYSELAASLGKSVVAVDTDDASVQRLYVARQAAGAAISPMVLNIARPSPALGWSNREVPSFLERAEGRFDCVLALGLMHHLLVTERVPLSRIAELLSRITTQTLIAEWIERDDPRFQEIAGSNLPLYANTTREAYEAAFRQHFRLVSKSQLPQRQTRTLYHWAR
jgi:SAM-dependent methyltransferase